MNPDTELELDLTGLSVCISIPAYDGKIPVEAGVALATTVSELRKMGIKVAMQYERSNGLIDICRNRLVDKFLKESGCQKLLFLDNDIVWKPEDMIRLLAWSTKYKVVGATYPSRQDTPSFFVKLKDEEIKLNEYQLLSCKGFGAGFLVIDRSVFETMEPHTEWYILDGKFTRYFQINIRDLETRRLSGEDIWFMSRWVDEFGGEVILDPWIELRHVGLKYYDYKFSDYLKEKLTNG